MNDGRYVLRPEARPMPTVALNKSQRKAMKGVVAALREAVHHSDQPPKAGFIDHHRMSRLFFVSGQPGSGKTSIYLTLCDLLSKDLDFRDEHKGDLDLDGLNGTIRWLEPIDLEVAGDEGENLLAAVLVRISDAIDQSSGMASKACREALDELTALANDIGIAWDGNLRARAASLDPDSYSQEVMRAQRTRLGTNKRLREVLDALLKNKCYGFKGEKIFVLPIDDFYLKPKASLELLRLLRMVSVPRLFFLIMGDIKTMEALFFEQALADWTNVAGPEVFASLEKRREEEILPRIREMRARYLRKLLPPKQRAIINWTQWYETLRYKPSVHDSSDCIHTLVSKICIWYRVDPESDPSCMTFLKFLFTPTCSEGQTKNANAQRSARVDCSDSKFKELKARRRKFREAYSALQILDATPREVADLWMGLKELAESSCNEPKEHDDKEVPKYLHQVVDFALLAIEEQDYLTEEQQDILRFAFPTSSVDDLLFQTDKLILRAKESLPQKIKCGDAFVRKHLDWKLGVSDHKGTVGPVPFLPPRTAAWIILLHDLTWSWKPDHITKNLVYDLCVRLLKEKSWKRPTLETLGWAWYKNKKASWIHFPLPSFNTFRQLDRFLAVWNNVLPPNPMKSAREELVRCWAFAMWIAENPENPESPEDLYDQFARGLLKMPNNGGEEITEFKSFKKDLFEKNKDFQQFASRGPQ